MLRWQLMQEYVQKSMRTTLPCREASEIGDPPGVLSHWVMPKMAGARPHSWRLAASSVQRDSWLFPASARPDRCGSSALLLATFCWREPV
jgi:hypothetical protein